ncbi:hypothetical protein IV454_05235 [Massilia antarctica]|uniref:DUF1640 domain-containing protein n=1 Tax=Massilia antarctica TaxID=2765360 RepID=A0AA49A9S4_9BURK|nr:hypothetical protein [Massilia antarctica]QPI50960.1 hypothetical protein IV454_05235 [Massilia antarctica]
MTSKFDALANTKRLEDAGVPRSQAEVHAKALTEVVSEFVCREDLLRLEGSLRHEIEESEKRLILHINLVKTELMAKIDGVDAKVDSKIDGVDAKIDSKIDRVDAKIDSLRSEFEARFKAIDHDLLVNRWLSGLIISLNIAMAIKIFFP